MKLVMRYIVSDGYTYSAICVLPFEYDSLERAELDFLEAWERAIKTNDPKFKFGRESFWVDDFSYEKQYNGPVFMTLEQWFEENRIC